MATKKLSLGTWRDRDGVRRSHKRGAVSNHVPRSTETYWDALTDAKRAVIQKRYGRRAMS